MTWSKYKGYSIEMILKEEPSFLVWLHNNTQFELGNELLEEAEGYTADMQELHQELQGHSDPEFYK